jgi:hypothetical protein
VDHINLVEIESFVCIEFGIFVLSQVEVVLEIQPLLLASGEQLASDEKSRNKSR